MTITPLGWAVLAVVLAGCAVGFFVALADHRKGRRPHPSLLAGTAAAVASIAVLVLVREPLLALLIPTAIYVAGHILLARAYRRRHGG